MQAFEGDVYRGWAEYVVFGGMPLTLSVRTDEQKARYLERLFTVTYLKDVVARNGVTKAQGLEDLVDVLASSIGALTNPPKIEADYNELRARGYSADVGTVEKCGRDGGKTVRKQLEVDFVANLGSKRLYIQSALHLPDPEKERQEKAPLLEIPDSFRKLVLVRDVVKPTYDEHGIMTMSVYDFLLDGGELG